MPSRRHRGQRVRGEAGGHRAAASEARRATVVRCGRPGRLRRGLAAIRAHRRRGVHRGPGGPSPEQCPTTPPAPRATARSTRTARHGGRDHRHPRRRPTGSHTRAQRPALRAVDQRPSARSGRRATRTGSDVRATLEHPADQLAGRVAGGGPPDPLQRRHQRTCRASWRRHFGRARGEMHHSRDLARAAGPRPGPAPRARGPRRRAARMPPRGCPSPQRGSATSRGRRRPAARPRRPGSCSSSAPSVSASVAYSSGAPHAAFRRRGSAGAMRRTAGIGGVSGARAMPQRTCCAWPRTRLRRSPRMAAATRERPRCRPATMASNARMSPVRAAGRTRPASPSSPAVVGGDPSGSIVARCCSTTVLRPANLIAAAGRRLAGPGRPLPGTRWRRAGRHAEPRDAPARARRMHRSLQSTRGTERALWRPDRRRLRGPAGVRSTRSGRGQCRRDRGQPRGRPRRDGRIALQDLPSTRSMPRCTPRRSPPPARWPTSSSPWPTRMRRRTLASAPR